MIDTKANAKENLGVFICGIRPICRLHFGQKIKFPQFHSQKWPRKNGLQNVPNMDFLLPLILLRFPPKKAKCVISARKSWQQIGLKAYLPFHCESESEIKSPDFHL